MTRAVKIAMAACACALMLCACEKAPETPDGVLAPIAAQDTLEIRPSDEDVADFLALLGEGAPKSYENDTCYNITPAFIKDNSGYVIFKFDQSCASYLLYEDTIYPLGGYFGGLGAVSFALADLNADGAYELYYTFSWGSGMHRSQVGYFDPATKAAADFDAAFYDKDTALAASPDGGLNVCVADIASREEESSFFVSFDISALEVVCAIVCEDGEILLREDAQDPE